MRALSTRNDDPAAASRPFDRGPRRLRHRRGRRRRWSSRRSSTPSPAARRRSPSSSATARRPMRRTSRCRRPGGIGAVRAARRALEKAGLEPGDIDHVNAHATSTPEGDKAELQAIRTILGDRRRRGPGHRQQVDDRPHAGRGRRDRGDRHRSMTIRDGCDPAHDQPRRPGPGGRGAGPDARTAAPPAGPRSPCRTRSGSVGRTPRSSSGGGTDDRRRASRARSDPDRRRWAQAVPRDEATELLAPRRSTRRSLLDRSRPTELEVEVGRDRPRPAQARRRSSAGRGPRRAAASWPDGPPRRRA